VAFIITMHNFVKGTAQGMLELFRTAHEVPSAEFILVDDGSSEADDTAAQAGARLRHYFGVDFRYIRNDPPLGYGAANMAGGARWQGRRCRVPGGASALSGCCCPRPAELPLPPSRLPPLQE
jgi:GT2 family glycosyltransferase